MNEITTVGVDLAKEVIAVCGADCAGRIVFTRVFRREAFATWAVRLPPCEFGLEACGASHHWARWLAAHGHRARIMAAEFVKPFRKSQGAKNDRNDAEAVLTAVRQPNMRFVAVKSVEQQAVLAWHGMRQGWIEERTALINRIRGQLGEFGVWVGRSADVLTRVLPRLEQDEALPVLVRRLLGQAHEQLRVLDDRIGICEAEIKQHAKASEAAQRIEAITGVGAITSGAIVATVTDARDFKNGRQFAAWVGLVPRQTSTGGKTRLGRITKRGNTYLRCLLTQGARSTLQVALQRLPDKRSRLEQWIVALFARVGYHKTMVAIANKHARMIWAILAKGEAYDPDAWQRRTAAPGVANA